MSKWLMSETEYLTKGKAVQYSLGNFATSMVVATVTAWLMYYYYPPLEKQALGNPVLLNIGLFIAVRNIGRLVDAIADPVVAFLSDKTESRLGRRKPYIIFGTIPLVIFGIMVWFPLTDGSSWANAIWLGIGLVGLWISFTVVVAPYLALMPELVRDEDKRMWVSVIMGLFEVLAMLIATFAAGALIEGFEDGLNLGFVHIPNGFQVAAIVFAVLGGIFFYVSIIGIKEPPKAKDQKVPFKFFKAFINTLKNKAMIPYLITITMVRIGFSTVIIGIPYIGRVYLEVGEFASGMLMGIIILVSAAFFPVVPKITHRLGLKKTYLLAFAIGIVLFPMGFLLKTLPSIPLEYKVENFLKDVENFELVNLLQEKENPNFFIENSEQILAISDMLRFKHAPTQEEMEVMDEATLERRAALMREDFSLFRLSVDQLIELEQLKTPAYWVSFDEEQMKIFKEDILPLLWHHARYEIRHNISILWEHNPGRLEEQTDYFRPLLDKAYYEDLTPEKLTYLRTEIAPLMKYFPNPVIWAFILFAFFGIPASIMLTTYRAIIAEVIDEDEKLYGYRREAIYFGMEGLGTKFGELMANSIGALLVWIIVSNALGATYYLTFLMAAVVCFLVGFLTFLKYPLGQRKHL